ncbi:protein MRG1 isoform X1 [Nymphaea colorata]|nr:protein MRG1 isoform X1 [Nymphaea colorata]
MGSSNAGGRRDSSSDDEGVGEESDGSGSPVFSEGEKVLAYHGPRIYEAKVQKAEIRKKEWKYFVHYHGWNKNWDEWVSADRLMKFNDENVRKQRTLLKKQGVDNPKTGRTTHPKPKISIGAKAEKEDPRNHAAKGKKRKSISAVEGKETGIPEKLVKIQFPSTLQKQLVDDWKFVTQLGKLVKLPRVPNVDDILKIYLEHQTKKDGMIAESVGEILSGLRCYFDKALPVMLLYKQERQQYQEAISEDSNISPSTIYGAEHLLRLFVKLPELLAYVNMDEETMAQLQKKLLEFLKFLQKKQSTFFVSTYDGPRYLGDAENKEQNTSS